MSDGISSLYKNDPNWINTCSNKTAIEVEQERILNDVELIKENIELQNFIEDFLEIYKKMQHLIDKKRKLDKKYGTNFCWTSLLNFENNKFIKRLTCLSKKFKK